MTARHWSFSPCDLLSKISISSLGLIPSILLQQCDDLIDIINIEHGLQVDDGHGHVIVVGFGLALASQQLFVLILVHILQKN